MTIPALRVRLLGGFELRSGDRALPPLGSVRAEALLAYLLLHRETPHPRQRLAFLLWPDSTEPQARTNLRHVLHKLRRALPDPDSYLDVRQRTLQWRPEAPAWIDVAEFEQALADDRLEDALDIYRGELLESSYDDWLLDQRERLTGLHLDTVDRLARRAESERRWPDAIRYAERLVRADPLREDSHRLLMRVYAASGERAAALRAYHDCATTLQRELGIEPGPDTDRVYKQLVATDSTPLTTVGAPAIPSKPAFVGRTSEIDMLRAHWARAADGNTAFVLTSGEPGVGKSRLVDELRAWCAHNGAVTAEARAYPGDGQLAYGLVAEWLRSAALSARLRRLDATDMSELARLLPELVSEMPDLPAPQPLPPEEQRTRLFGALGRTFLLPGTPLLLIVDDLQWADGQSLAFLHYFLRSWPEAPVLVAATARREELDPRHRVTEFITALRTLGVFSEIELDRLNRAETRLLAQHVSGTELTVADADRLYADSEGNPLFVVEAVRAGLDAGHSGPTDRVQGVIDARLAQLSEHAADVVGVAAAIGRGFVAEVLAAASDVDERAFVRALDELWRRGLIRSRGPNAYDFSHGMIRDVAYRSLGPARSRHHHLAVARALERHQGGDPGSGVIAAHYDAAGAAEDAVHWYQRAAAASQRLHANADAARQLERALALLDTLQPGPDRDRTELQVLTALPVALLAVEGYMSGRMAELHRRAITVAERLGVEPEPPLLRSLALAALARGDFEAAYSFGEQLRDRAIHDHDEVVKVEAAYVLGIAAYWQGYLDAAITQFEIAVEGARPEHRAVHLVRYGQDPEVVCLTRLAHALWLLGRDEDAERTRERGLALAERRGHPYSLAVGAVWSAIFALDQRDHTRLRSYLGIVDPSEPVYDAPQIQIVLGALSGLLAVLDGNGAAAVERVRATIEPALQQPPATPGFHALLTRILLETYAASDDPSRGLAAAEAGLTTPGTQLWEAEIRRLRAGFLRAVGGSTAEVEGELRRALTVAAGQGAHPFERRIWHDLDRLRAPAS